MFSLVTCLGIAASAMAQPAYLVDLRLYEAPGRTGQGAALGEPGEPIVLREGESAHVTPDLRVSVIGGALMWNGRARGQDIGVERLYAPQFQVAAGQRATMEVAQQAEVYTYLEPVEPDERLYRAVTETAGVGYRADVTVRRAGGPSVQVEVEATYALLGEREALPALDFNVGRPKRIEASFSAAYQAPLEAWSLLRRRTGAGALLLLARIRPGEGGEAGLPEAAEAPGAVVAPGTAQRPAGVEEAIVRVRLRRFVLPPGAADQVTSRLIPDPEADAGEKATVFRAVDPAAWLQPELAPLEDPALTARGAPRNPPQIPYSGERVVNGQTVAVMGYAKRIDPYQDAGAVADWLAAQPGVKTGATSWFAMTTGGLAEDVAPALAARSKVVEAGEVVIAGGGVDGAAPPGAWSGELYGLRLERAMPRNGLELSAAYDIRLDSGLRAQGRAAARLRLRHWLGVAVMAEEGIVVLIMEARPGRPGAGTPSQVRLAPRADG